MFIVFFTFMDLRKLKGYVIIFNAGFYGNTKPGALGPHEESHVGQTRPGGAT
jgi:hypothetical protein